MHCRKGIDFFYKKDTWELIKRRGIDAVINDNLIGNVLFLGSILIAGLNAVIGYLFTLAWKPLPVNGVDITLFMVIFSFLIGLLLSITIMEIVNSGVATTFVCLAEDPEALRRTKPELWEKVRETWPQAVSRV